MTGFPILVPGSARTYAKVQDMSPAPSPFNSRRSHTGAVNDAVAAVLAGAAEVSGWQEDLYRDLHSHPELSHQEHRTAGKAADRLTTAGFEVISGVGGTGVVGVLRNGGGPSVLLRADMDALPLT